MARLYDEVLAAGLFDNTSPACGVVTVDNVAAYWFAGHTPEQRKQSNGWSDFPNMAPPFEQVFMEYQFDVMKHCGESPNHPTRWGAVVHGFQGDRARGGWAGVGETSGKPVDPGPVEWLLCMQSVFMDRWDTHPHVGPQVWVPVAADGRIAPNNEAIILAPEHFPDGALDNSGKFLMPMLLAICFMHCKNVERRPVDQPPKLSKKWEKKHGRPLVRYHVLDIDPMRKVLKDEGGSEETGLKKALHICRGHFATYTDEAPLFGRVTGTFWKPQHIRGSKKQGLVIKDYNVKAPTHPQERER